MSLPSLMRALQVVEYGKPYELAQVPVPDISDNELLIQVKAAGFCHSDLQVFDGEWDTQLPQVGSHEPAGIVAKVGRNVTGGWQVGDRVGVLNFKYACTTCADCRTTKLLRSGFDPRFCGARKQAGFTCHGAFADYMTADPDTTVKLPASISFEQGAPLFCAGATIWGAVRKATAGLQQGETIGMIGIGGLGQLGIQFLKALGFRVIAMDNHPQGRNLAEQIGQGLGPDLIVDSAQAEDARQQVFDFTGGAGLAAVVVATEPVEVSTWSLTLLRVFGTAVILGLPAEMWQFSAQLINFKELTLRGSFVAGRDEVETMLQLIDKFNVQSVLTVIDLDDAVKIPDMYRARDYKGRLVVRI